MTKKEENTDLKKKVENGKIVSPVLPDGVKNYLIDIDGTIGDDIPNEEPERMVTAKHYPDALRQLTIGITRVIICFFTSRIESHRKVTEDWLNKHGFKFHSLLMGNQEEVIIIGSTTTL